MQTTSTQYCLTHQLPETGTSPAGPVCPCCKQIIYRQGLPAAGAQRGYWESQPGAYTLDRQPIFIYVRQGENYCIRSLREEDTASF